jgi:hypothetical protein
MPVSGRLCDLPTNPPRGFLRARLSTRAVQKLSQQIAQEKGNNQDYYISHGWLTEVENGKFTPSIYKLYSLSLIYKCSYLKIMGFFGINILHAAKEQRLVSLPQPPRADPRRRPGGPKVGMPRRASS